MDCPCTVYKPTSICWSKAASKEIYQYQSIVAQSLVGLGRMLSDDIVLCCNPSCISHQTRLDEISNQLVTCPKVYACLIDASKAFDLVDHRILFDKLLERGTPKPVVFLLLRWYKSQQLCIRWMGRSSEHFKVTNGVRQGGVLSPILFTIYLDSLLECLQASGRGCYWDNYFAGALCYADDLTILAPSPDALRKMIADCRLLVILMGYVSILLRLN